QQIKRSRRHRNQRRLWAQDIQPLASVSEDAVVHQRIKLNQTTSQVVRVIPRRWILIPSNPCGSAANQEHHQQETGQSTEPNHAPPSRTPSQSTQPPRPESANAAAPSATGPLPAPVRPLLPRRPPAIAPRSFSPSRRPPNLPTPSAPAAIP